jgi:hypothetical protein
MKIESKLHILTQVFLYMGSSLQLFATALQLTQLIQLGKSYNDTSEGVYLSIFPPIALTIKSEIKSYNYFTFNTHKCLHIRQMREMLKIYLQPPKHKCEYAPLAITLMLFHSNSKHFKSRSVAFPAVLLFVLSLLAMYDAPASYSLG